MADRMMATRDYGTGEYGDVRLEAVDRNEGRRLYVDSGLWLEVESPEDGSGAASYPLLPEEARKLARFLEDAADRRESWLRARGLLAVVVLAVSVFVTGTAHQAAAHVPGEPVPAVWEDSGRWDCWHMGNRRCGPGSPAHTYWTLL